MLTIKNGSSDDGLLCFLRHNPSLSTSLLTDCDQDIQEVTTIIEPVLQAPQRCQSATYFIQGVSLGHTGFLATNLGRTTKSRIQATDISSSWSIGRGGTCAVNIADKVISRCHAVITHCVGSGFFLTDLGSKNGTWINGGRVMPNTRHRLTDGDLLQFGSVKVELFISNHQNGYADELSVAGMTTTSG